MTPNDVATIALLTTLDMTTYRDGRVTGNFRRDDGSLLTDEEAELVRSATWDHLVAGREVLVLALELEKSL